MKSYIAIFLTIISVSWFLGIECSNLCEEIQPDIVYLDVFISDYEKPDEEPTEVPSIVPDNQEEATEQIPETVIVVNEKAKEYIGKFKLTAYCSCEKCCGKWAKSRPIDENGNTIVYGSTGAVLEAGMSIAVDPEVIPYGSEVVINNHTYKADDCGGAIKGNHIDVYFDNHQDALIFGVQYADVFIGKGE